MSDILQLFNSFKQILPDVIQWIDQYIAQHIDKARAVSTFDVKYLGDYFSKDLLARSKVVFVDRVELPPLSRMGLPFFTDFEKIQYSGITYKDFFFLAPEACHRESTWFHEMIHIVQWDELTPASFLITYAFGLLTDGYRNSPLEAMAYGFQAKFEDQAAIPGIEYQVRQKSRHIAGTAAQTIDITGMNVKI